MDETVTLLAQKQSPCMETYKNLLNTFKTNKVLDESTLSHLKDFIPDSVENYLSIKELLLALRNQSYNTGFTKLSILIEILYGRIHALCDYSEVSPKQQIFLRESFYDLLEVLKTPKIFEIPKLVEIRKQVVLELASFLLTHKTPENQKLVDKFPELIYPLVLAGRNLSNPIHKKEHARTVFLERFTLFHLFLESKPLISLRILQQLRKISSKNLFQYFPKEMSLQKYVNSVDSLLTKEKRFKEVLLFRLALPENVAVGGLVELLLVRCSLPEFASFLQDVQKDKFDTEDETGVSLVETLSGNKTVDIVAFSRDTKCRDVVELVFNNAEFKAADLRRSFVSVCEAFDRQTKVLVAQKLLYSFCWTAKKSFEKLVESEKVFSDPVRVFIDSHEFVFVPKTGFSFAVGSFVSKEFGLASEEVLPELLFALARLNKTEKAFLFDFVEQRFVGLTRDFTCQEEPIVQRHIP